MARCSKRRVAEGGGWIVSAVARVICAGAGAAAAERGRAASSRPQSRVRQLQEREATLSPHGSGPPAGQRCEDKRWRRRLTDLRIPRGSIAHGLRAAKVHFAAHPGLLRGERGGKRSALSASSAVRFFARQVHSAARGGASWLVHGGRNLPRLVIARRAAARRSNPSLESEIASGLRPLAMTNPRLVYAKLY
jgi:hypothetical protein